MYPVLLQLGPFAVQTFWVITTIAIIVSGSLFVHIAKRERLSLRPFLDHSWSLILATLVGSRLVFIAMNSELFLPTDAVSLLRPLFLWDRGLSLWGGAFFFFLRLINLLRRDKELLLRYVDALTLPILLGYAIGKIGAFLDGGAYGLPTMLPWGVTFESANVPYTVPIHPTQLYATLYAVAIGLLVPRLVRAEQPGMRFFFSSGVFALSRMLEEFVRGDEVLLVLDFVRLPQLIAGACVLAIGFHIYKKRKTFFAP